MPDELGDKAAMVLVEVPATGDVLAAGVALAEGARPGGPGVIAGLIVLTLAGGLAATSGALEAVVKGV